MKFDLKKIFKDKKVMIILPILMMGLLLVVFLKTNSNEVTEIKEAGKSVLEPVSEEEQKLANKLEAYKKDKEAENKEKKELEESQVKGSDFYFDMQGSDGKYSERMKERISKMQSDPYSEAMNEYQQKGESGGVADKMRSQLSEIDDKEDFEQFMRQKEKNIRMRKDLNESESFRQALYDKYIPKAPKDSATLFPKVTNKGEVKDVKLEPRFIVVDGKRQRRPQYEVPGKANLVKAAIYGDQIIVSGTPVKMRLLEPLLVSGVEIPANTIFAGTATLGANRMKVTVENFRYGSYMSPVSFNIYDNDAIEGLNLPNNMKAEAARRMEQGLLQGVQLPLSSIGTVTSEVTSALTATTQVARQILNQGLSQIKVHLKANYQIFLKEETTEDKRKREAEEAELERLYKQFEMQKNEPAKKNPLTSIIESL